MTPSIPQILLLLFVALMTIVPPALVIASGRSQGGAKFGWFLLAAFFSWIGYVLFWFSTKGDRK